jgi:gliding motility-associated-like protein
MSLGKVVSWNWDFGNGQTSISANPAVQHYRIADNITSYPVRLAIMDTTGCTDTAYHFLQVAGNCYISVPSAFTPNRDGLNDYLYPLNAYKATNLLFSVYNRHGQHLFVTRDWTRKWDGTVGGKAQAAGVYVWVLDYTDASRKKISLRGTTVLIR